ncbi:MAG: Ig-like domain-containing protein, partial [Candidatus Thorarchaeota archaeon]
WAYVWHEVEPGVFRWTIQYTPDPNWHGTITPLRYGVRDSLQAESNAAYIYITVNSVPDVPVAEDDVYIIDEDAVLQTDVTTGVLANDFDGDGDALTVQLISGPAHGSLIFNADGSFIYTPDANWFGEDSFVYEVSDGALTDTATVTITVNSVNDAPVAVDDYVVTDEDTPIIIDYMANDYDIEGHAIDRSWVSWYPDQIHGQWAYVWHEVEPGVFRWTIQYTPDPNWHGTITPLRYGVRDSLQAESNAAYIYITVNSVPDVPVAEDDVYIIDEDAVLQTDVTTGVLANDFDGDGDALTVQLISGPSHGSLIFNADGSFIYTPDANWFGEDSFVYEASDGALTNTATVTITVNSVNDAPVAVDDYVVTDEDTPIIIDYMANDYDIEGHTLSRSWVSWYPDQIHGQWAYVWHEVEPGVFRWTIQYTPDPNWHGTITPLRYGIRDSLQAESNAAYIYITVNPVNDAPVAVDDTYTTNEDTVLQTDVTLGVLANDADIDGDALQAVLETGPSNGALTLNADGSFTYIPDADFWGVDSFSYQASDGLLQSNVVTVTITILSVNDAPVAVDDYVTTDEDTPIIIDFMANDFDVDGNSFDWSLIVWNTIEIHGQGQLVSIEISPGVTRTGIQYTPDPNWHGSSSSMYYYITDSHGAVSIAGHIYITVNPVNDSPVAEDDAYTADEDTFLQVDSAMGVLANDMDVDGNQLAVQLVSGPSHGLLTMNPDGSFSYTPDADWFGEDSFVYEVSDGALTDTATVTITINSVNDAPVAVDDAYSTDEDVTLTVVAPGLLANDFDVEYDVLTAVLVDAPLHGTVFLEPDGALTYIPDSDWYGVDTLAYQVFDGTDYGNIATVTITVNYVNTPPTAVDDAYTTEGGVTLIVEAPGVLDNDDDVDEDPLEALLTGSPMHGTVILYSDGSFTYAPAAAWCGVDTFTYNVFDGREYSDIAVVTITVIDVTPPVTMIQFTGVEGEHGWYHSDIEVTLKAIDDCSGVESTSYSFNGSTWMLYVDPFVLSDPGEITVYYYSADCAGNVEDAKTATIKIGKPTRDFVTGGGWIWDSEGKGHFQFVVKYKCGVLKGFLLYTFREDGYRYIVRSTHWFGMAIDGDHALLDGEARILRFNCETKDWECLSNFYFRVEIWDMGRCKSDIFQIRIYDESGEQFHEAGFDPLGEVQRGNIRVHHRGPKCKCKHWSEKRRFQYL